MVNRRILFLTTLIAALSGCATVSAPASIAETIATNPSLTTLNGLIVKAGLADTLKGPGPFTVFAPTNDAFKAVPAKTMTELAADPAKLKAVLTYHVLPGKVTSAEIKNGPAKTVHGANIAVNRSGEFVTVEDSLVQQANVMASNGVVHTVDRVMMPPAPAR